MIYIHTYTLTVIHTHTHTTIHTQTSIRPTHIHIYRQPYIHAYTHTHTYIHTHTHIHAYIPRKWVRIGDSGYHMGMADYATHAHKLARLVSDLFGVSLLGAPLMAPCRLRPIVQLLGHLCATCGQHTLVWLRLSVCMTVSVYVCMCVYA